MGCMRVVERIRPTTDDVIAGLAGVAAVSGSYAVTAGTPAFIASSVERFISRTAPIELIIFAIQTFGDLGQKLNLVFAGLLVAILIGTIVRIAIAIGEQSNHRLLGIVLAGGGAWGVAVALSGGYVLSLGSGIPAAMVVASPRVARLSPRITEPISSKRRRALSTVGAIGVVVGTGTVLGHYFSRESRSGGDLDLEGPNVNQDVIEAGIKSAREQELDVPGLRPLVSDNFYEVDINAVDPDIDAENWSLSITGEVEESLTWDYEYLRALPAENRFVTLRCVSDDIHDLKMDNALWTGVHVRHVLDGAMPTSNCNCVRLHAEDGYYQVFPLEAFEDGMLAYGMNGKPLSRGHGYPVRTLVPGHWGEINVKWLTEIEFLNEDAEGYWEKRGWYGTGTVVPVAKLEVTQKREDGSRVLGGHAYAGTRGVASVEVSTDGGDTWADARLSDPLDEFNTPIGAHIDATDAWRQWSYEYAPPGGTYTVVVRLIDSNGNVQPSEERDPYPRGASGWASRELTN